MNDECKLHEGCTVSYDGEACPICDYIAELEHKITELKDELSVAHSTIMDLYEELRHKNFWRYI